MPASKSAYGLTGQPATNEQLDARTSLARNGRSFFWAAHLLGHKMAGDAARLYAFCRILDDMADGDIPDGPRRLRQIQDFLAGRTRQCDPALAGFLPLMQQAGLPAPALSHLIEGLLSDQGPVALDDEAGLVRYCYRVAGTVGLMMCPLLDCPDPQAARFAIDMGIAMQMTNIARDVLEDARMGRCYLPASWTGHKSVADILAAADAPDQPASCQTDLAIRSALARLLDKADIYYASGEQGLAALPWRARSAIGVAGRVYRQIGRQLIKRDLDWRAGRVVTSPLAKTMASLHGLAAAARQSGRPALGRHDTSLHTALADLI